MTKEYFWMDDSDYVVVGAFNTEAEARKYAEDSAKDQQNHTRTYSILLRTSVSAPPSLTRKWKLS